MVDEPTTNTADPGGGPPLLPPAALMALLCGLFVLLVMVIAVGLKRGDLDPTGVALALISAIGGIGGGTLLRQIRGGGGDR